MKKTRRLFLATALMGAMTLSPVVMAQPGFGGAQGERHGQFSEERMQKRLNKMSQKLGLSAEQRSQIENLMRTKHQSRQSFKPRMQAIREQMKNLDPMAADYSVQLESLANQKANLVREKTMMRGQHRQQMARILTPEQRQQWKAMKEKRQQRMMKRREG